MEGVESGAGRDVGDVEGGGRWVDLASDISGTL